MLIVIWATILADYFNLCQFASLCLLTQQGERASGPEQREEEGIHMHKHQHVVSPAVNMQGVCDVTLDFSPSTVNSVHSIFPTKV